MDYEQKLKNLRVNLHDHGLDGYLIPRSDSFLSEYVPADSERLLYMTGFTGSAGLCAVLKDRAIVMSDGRYTVQLKQQVDSGLFETGDMVRTGISSWLKNNLEAKARIGYDPWLHRQAEIEKLKTDNTSIEFIPNQENLVDKIWKNRPDPPRSPIEVFPENVAGLSVNEKMERVGHFIQGKGAQAHFVALPESLCWLLNIRATDVPNTPVLLSRGVLICDPDLRFIWFIDPDRVTQDVQKTLPSYVSIQPPEKFKEILQSIDCDPFLLDEKRCPAAIFDWLSDRTIIRNEDPCLLPRACKTVSELDHMRQSHVTDGVAVTRFLYWLDHIEDYATLDELSVEAELAAFRAKDKNFAGPSFDTIAGFQSNGAIIHYRATAKSARSLEKNGVLLLDSGAQYNGPDHWGTTDITRTIPLGDGVDPAIKAQYTRVLKGHIALAQCRFPEGTTGVQLDALVRAPLWQAGEDYAHGTGHGVGCYLSVHEEAASLSPRGDRPLKPGMVLSNEPGFYVEDSHGIRIENLVEVCDTGERDALGRKILAFETLTLAPIDTRLVVKDLLHAHERNWLNAYHARVFETLSSRLVEERSWLEHMTKPL